VDDTHALNHADIIELMYSKSTYHRMYGELYKTIDSSDVILHVPDARDSLGTLCESVLEYMRKEKAHTQVVLLLNKCTLVPAWGSQASTSSSRPTAPNGRGRARPSPRKRRCSPQIRPGMLPLPGRRAPYMHTTRFTSDFAAVIPPPTPAAAAAALHQLLTVEPVSGERDVLVFHSRNYLTLASCPKSSCGSLTIGSPSTPRAGASRA
jgi:hypothetical protein